MGNKSIQFFNRHKSFVFILTVLVMMFSAQAVLRAEDRNVVTLFVDGQERILPTTATTVGEFLDRAEVSVFEHDLVEPSRDSQIGTDSYNINIYRARPVTVIDGNKRFKVMSPYESPQRIAESAGLEVYDEDEYELERIDNILLEGALGLRMTIDRSIPIKLNLYGEAYDIRTQSDSVEELLIEKGIELTQKDKVKPKASTGLKAGQTVFVLKTGTDVSVEDVVIDFTTEEINDSAQEIGYRQVREAGVTGQKTVTYELKLENGKEVSRKKLNEVIIREAKTEVVVVGTKPVAPTASNISGSKTDWMRAAGIPESEWTYVDFIVGRESGWNPNAVNPSSGACGLGQQLPCGKWAGAWNDPVAALQGQYGYVVARYGSYAGAYAFWSANHWY